MIILRYRIILTVILLLGWFVYPAVAVGNLLGSLLGGARGRTRPERPNSKIIDHPADYKPPTHTQNNPSSHVIIDQLLGNTGHSEQHISSFGNTGHSQQHTSSGNNVVQNNHERTLSKIDSLLQESADAEIHKFDLKNVPTGSHKSHDEADSKCGCRGGLDELRFRVIAEFNGLRHRTWKVDFDWCDYQVAARASKLLWCTKDFWNSILPDALKCHVEGIVKGDQDAILKLKTEIALISCRSAEVILRNIYRRRRYLKGVVRGEIDECDWLFGPMGGAKPKVDLGKILLRWILIFLELSQHCS